MRIARILEIDAYTMLSQHPESRYLEYLILNEDEYHEDMPVLVSHVAQKNRHLTIDAAKDAAYNQGYREYIYKGKHIKFRESRNQKKYNMNLS